MHAGELEVSLLLHGYPELADDSYRSADGQADPRPHLLVTGMRGYTETGIIGRPSLASADKGHAILESLARSFKDHLALLPSMPTYDDANSPPLLGRSASAYPCLLCS
jgi:creatinine amidohydrolase